MDSQEVTHAIPYNMDKFIEIAHRYGKFDLNTYFETTGNKYSILLINYDNSDLIFQDGYSLKQFLHDCIRDFDFVNKGISALYGPHPSITNVDVFMVNQNLVGTEDEEIIIFHEICHLLEKRGYYKSLGIEFSEDEIKVGNELEKIANKLDEFSGGWGEDKNHNSLFGRLLFHFLKGFDFDNRYSLLSRAMSKNFLDDYSEEFKIAGNR